MDDQDEQRVHDNVGLAGLRAHATAVGLVQLSAELVRAGLIDIAAIDRIKDAIARELTLQRPRSAAKADFERAVRQRLDALFPGTTATPSETGFISRAAAAP